jgi:hypothetical protein
MAAPKQPRPSVQDGQPEPKIIPNNPASSVQQALANSAKQVDQAK